VKMFGCVLIFRRVAAPNVPARQAETQVYPSVARLQTLLATLRMRMHIPNLIHVGTFVHCVPPFRHH
jgi:hypothetical protein